MEVKTIVLDEKEYVLIPREIFEKIFGGIPKSESPLPLATKEEQKESIMVVDSLPEIRKAKGSDYGFAHRLKTKTLVPEDVMVTNTHFDKMPETREIAANDSKNNMPPGKFGFYGPGIERDF